MGRYPFLELLNNYLENITPYYDEKTINERRYRLTFIHNNILQKLKEQCKISTTNPTKMQKNDIDTIIFEFKRRGYSQNYKVKLVDMLKGLLRFCGNSILDRDDIKKMLPKRIDKNLNPLDVKEIRIIQSCVDQAQLGPWYKTVGRFIMEFLPFTGLRSCELVGMTVDDIDLEKEQITVREPKGKNKYADIRWVPVMNNLKPLIRRYLNEREKYLSKHNASDIKSLIPAIGKNGKGKPIDSRALRTIKSRIENVVKEEYGVSFTLHTFRGTYGQLLLDQGAPIEVVSKLLGHKTTKTTELHYSRVRDKIALELGKKALNNIQILPIKIQSPAIEDKNEMTGYA